MNLRILLAVGLVTAVAFAALAVGFFTRGDSSGGDSAASEGGVISQPSAFQGAKIPAGVKAPDFTLTDESGEPITMRQFRGKPVIVTFLYTHCEDTCPIQAQTVRGALDELGHDVPALAIAVDPPNDTPRSARKFLAEQRVSGRLDFVLGSRAELRPLWNGFGVQPQRVTEEHNARITLVDARGIQRVGYPGSEATPERLAHDLALLEREAG
ncbi:MAG: SCO family protein [Thermoleophilaceae bacterium]